MKKIRGSGSRALSIVVTAAMILSSFGMSSIQTFANELPARGVAGNTQNTSSDKTSQKGTSNQDNDENSQGKAKTELNKSTESEMKNEAKKNAEDESAMRVISSKNYALVKGVTEKDLVFNNNSGNSQVAGFMTTVSPDANVSFKASYGEYYDKYDRDSGHSSWKTGDWNLAKMSDQASSYEKATGKNVIFATNGDFFNMQTGQPLGALFIDGRDCNPDKTGTEPFFCVTKDGKYSIRDAGSDTSDVKEALAGPYYLVKDGKNVANKSTQLYPVNSIGLKKDGSVVCFMADGKQAPYSVGMTQEEQANYLISQGVVNAIYLDGGGSACVLTKREGEKNLNIRNNPSDGDERTVSSGLLLVSNAQGDGSFDHASVSPRSESYTPGSTVQFKASGIDSAGDKAELPENGLSWRLSDDSENMGSVDASTGKFTSNGTVGNVTVQLIYNSKVVGSSSVKIAEPDEIYFGSKNISLDFGEKSNLGLVVRADKGSVNIKPGDLKWTIKSDSQGVGDNEIGRIDGNTFVAGKAYSTMNATVTVSYTRQDGSDLTANVKVEIGKMPVTAFDFEPVNGVKQTGAHYDWLYSKYGDKGSYTGNVNSVKICTSGMSVPGATYEDVKPPFSYSGLYEWGPAGDIFKANGYSYYIWRNSAMNTYGAGSVTTSSKADGGQVKTGNYSLELDYDYASYNGSSNANFYIMPTSSYEIEGTPNQAGVWVYADSNAKGYALYTDIHYYDPGKKDYRVKSFPLKSSVSGSQYIDWTGWMYCSADISSLAQYRSDEHPLYISNYWGGFLWLSFQPGKSKETGAKRNAGTLYFDNYRFVYGTDQDDTDNPFIKNVSVNDQELSDSEKTTIKTSDVEIKSEFADKDGKNASGINAKATIIQVDGKKINCDGDNHTVHTILTLPNGRHSVTVTVYDNSGNSATKTSYFYVKADSNIEGSVSLSGNDTVTMGSNYALKLTASGKVKKATVDVNQLNTAFGEPKATFADGWTGKVTYSKSVFRKAKITIEAEWIGKGDVPVNSDIATLSFDVPSTLDPEMDKFTYIVPSATSVLNDNTTTTASQPLVSLDLSAYYTATAGIAVAGEETSIFITDPNGKAAKDVTVLINKKEAGTTDENGQLKTDVTKNMKSGETFTVSAKKGDLVSFNTTVTVVANSGNKQGLPVGITLTASQNGNTGKTISWMSNASVTDSAAYVKYSTSKDMTDAKEVSGTSRLHAFMITNNASRINIVTMQNLDEGKTYYYQVGDGKEGHWSGVRSFTTTESGKAEKFFVLGDTQMSGNKTTDADQIALLDKIGSAVSDYDFGLQTGDYIDNGGNYGQWEEMQNVFSEKFPSIDLIHTLGNHEYFGDSNGSAAKNLFGLNGSEYYSVTYGNVYIAVINNGADLQTAADWLVADASKSKATWKILSIHQPPYYTNVNGGSEKYNQVIPTAAEKAGINVVFSGHDHSYARTEPLKNGKVNKDEGITYFICGDLGEKSRNINYAITDNPDFHFAKTSQDYDALYLSVSTGKNEMIIKAMNSDGSEIDNTTIKKQDKCAEGHTWDKYDRKTGLLTCSVCGISKSAEELKYTGLVYDESSERYCYLDRGKLSTGWKYIDKAYYYFDKNGNAYVGTRKIGNVTYQFNEKGMTKGAWYSDKNGKKFYYGPGYYHAQNHNYKTLQEIDGKTYNFDENGYVTIGIVALRGAILDKIEFYEFGKDGALIKKITDEGVVEYENNWYYIGPKGYVECGAGLVKDTKGDYYFVNPSGKIKTDTETWIGKGKTHSLIPYGWYKFGSDGKLVKSTGIEKHGDEYCYRKDGIIQAGLGLIKIDNKYYYVLENGTLASNKDQKISEAKANNLMPAGTYAFGNDAKMILEDKVVQKNGHYYYYKNGAMQKNNGLIRVGDDYYFVNANGTLVTNTETWVGKSKTNSLAPYGWYKFGSDGKLVKFTGLENYKGTYSYKKDGIIQAGLGLVKIDNAYYYIYDNGSMAVNRDQNIKNTKTNNLMPAGIYTFGSDAKMILLNGVVQKNNTYYYYINGVMQKNSGLVTVGNDYYFVTSNGKLATDTETWVGKSKTNSLAPYGWYKFGSDGKLVKFTGLENYKGTYSYKKDGIIQAGLGLVKIDNAYYYIYDNGSVATDKNVRIKKSKTNDLMPAGTYKFGKDAKMVLDTKEKN